MADDKVLSPEDAGMTNMQRRQLGEPVSATGELGTTGLKRFGGYIHEEFLPELTGMQATKTYREMSDNDPTIKGMLFAVEMLLRSVDWDVEPFATESEDVRNAAFVKSCKDDMEVPWSENIAENLSCLRYGFSYHEVCYKYRRGESDDPTQNSNYNDGLLGWRKMPLRAQDSLLRWEFADNGDVIAMEQLAPPHYITTVLPMTKCLLFRTSMHKGNPQGDSVLRACYRPWFLKTHIENIEAIGVERDLTGIPVVWVPPHLLADDASESDKRALADWKKIVTNMKRDEQEGLVMPLAYDENGNKVYDFTLMTSGGRRQFDTDAIINRYDRQMATSILADFIFIGHQKVGTQALYDGKTDIFAIAVGAWADSIADVYNRVEIPRLFKLNGKRTDRLPKLTHGEVKATDLEKFGAYLKNLQSAGMPLFPDDSLEAFCRRIAGMPQKALVDRARADIGGGGAGGAPDPTLEKSKPVENQPGSQAGQLNPAPAAPIAGRV